MRLERPSDRVGAYFPNHKGHRKKRPLIQLVRCGEYKKKAKVKRTESLVNTFVSNQVWMQCLIVAVYKSYHYHNINMEQFLEAWPNIIQQIKVKTLHFNTRVALTSSSYT